MSASEERAEALRVALDTITDKDVERFNLDACDVIDLAEYVRSGRRGVPADLLRPFVSIPEEALQEVPAGHRY